jgi:cytidylate kinase
MAVITISRELGSCGREIATAVADRLGYKLLDRGIVDAIAERAGVRVDAVHHLDERHFSGFDSVVSSLVWSCFGSQLTPETFRVMAVRLIREVARTGNIVILGRGAAAVLGPSRDYLHLRVIAPFDERARRVAERDGIDEREARFRIRESDTSRRSFVRSIGHCDWDDPTLYDMILNTGRVPLDMAIDLVLARHSQLISQSAPLAERPAKARKVA